MATERSKRETIFPGSTQWSRTLGSESRRESKSSIPGPSTLAPHREDKRPMRRINLPVNPIGSNRDHLVPVKEGSPWKYYKYAYDLELGGSVAIVCKTPATNKLFAMHSISGQNSEREQKLYTLRQLNHENLLRPEEILSFKDSFYIISECAAISLEEVIVVRPSEVQLAAIVHQLLDVICYLLSQNLKHGSLNRANILLTTEGVVKIANFENCSTIAVPEDQLIDIRAMGALMRDLMGEDSDTVSSTGTSLLPKQPTNWSTEAVDFLALTMVASGSELAKHPFLESAPYIHELVPLIGLAQVSACRLYSLRNSYMHVSFSA
ncbi:Serine/threonine-protein kinase dst2 [Fusarium austroafricanum]|uniref:Serine/threonine-protein kinase dst2 n=1 Tax=Fusarium austroafricanum TaxID=2364996 RepID=A0A8H4KJS7_9HYPO|nr:Serine/threonine-protein kinase dst2 [Fusarium austroafricanum]